MNKKNLAIPLAAVALVLSAGGGIVAAAHADTTTTTSSQTAPVQGEDSHPKPAAVGTVKAISGTTITLTDEQNGTTYTVDAANANVMKHAEPSATATLQEPTAPTTISVSGIQVGDTLMVQGTTSGTTITATRIDDGKMPHGGPGGRGPGVRGTVTAVNGSTLTVTGENGTSYTVDASDAEATKMQTISVSDVTVGDSVGIEGTVSGSNITATHVMDGISAPKKAS